MRVDVEDLMRSETVQLVDFLGVVLDLFALVKDVLELLLHIKV